MKPSAWLSVLLLFSFLFLMGCLERQDFPRPTATPAPEITAVPTLDMNEQPPPLPDENTDDVPPLPEENTPVPTLPDDGDLPPLPE